MRFTTFFFRFQVCSAESLSVIFYSLAMALGFPIILNFLTMEKEENVKHLLEVNGMRVRNFWLATLIFFFVFFAGGAVLFFVLGKFLMDDSLFQAVSILDIAIFIVGWNFNQIIFSIFLTQQSGKEMPKARR